MEVAVISREELYELVWSIPMTKVAERFDVSGSYMARVCSVLRVPRPERGYWAKLAAGRVMKRPSLPDTQPGDQVVWSKDGQLGAVSIARLLTPSSVPPRKITKRIGGIHDLVRGAKGHFEEGRKVDEGHYLKPYKKLLVDVTASMAGLDKALKFANDLFNALESVGHRAMIAPPSERFSRAYIDAQEQPARRSHQNHWYDYNRPWSPYRPTVVYVGSVALGIAIIEMSEAVALRYVKGKYIRESEYVAPRASWRHLDSTWTTTRELPCNRLRLVVYSPYPSVSWSISFQETKIRRLRKDLAEIVKTIEHSTDTLIERLREAERQAELRRLERLAEEARQRHEEDQRRVAHSIKESKEQLATVIQAWSEAVALEQFFQRIEDGAQILPDDKRREVMARLQLARQFVGTQDPMEFFVSWKTPIERYVPLSMRKSDARIGDQGGREEDS